MRTRSLVLGWIAVFGACFAGVLVPAAQAETAQGESARVLDSIEDYRQQTWRWQRLMGVRLSPTQPDGRAIGESRLPAVDALVLA